MGSALDLRRTSTGYSESVMMFMLRGCRLRCKKIVNWLSMKYFTWVLCKISQSLCQMILMRKINMHQLATKFVPRLMTYDQKKCVQISQDLVEWSNEHEDCYNKFETWVYGYDIGTKTVITVSGENHCQDQKLAKVIQMWSGCWLSFLIKLVLFIVGPSHMVRLSVWVLLE